MKTTRRRARFARMALVAVIPLFGLGCIPDFITNPGPAQTLVRTQFDAWRGGLLSWFALGVDFADDVGIDFGR